MTQCYIRHSWGPTGVLLGPVLFDVFLIWPLLAAFFPLSLISEGWMCKFIIAFGVINDEVLYSSQMGFHREFLWRLFCLMCFLYDSLMDAEWKSQLVRVCEVISYAVIHSSKMGCRMGLLCRLSLEVFLPDSLVIEEEMSHILVVSEVIVSEGVYSRQGRCAVVLSCVYDMFVVFFCVVIICELVNL